MPRVPLQQLLLNLILAVPADSGVAPTCYTDFTEAAREYRARDRSIDNVPTRRVKEGKGEARGQTSFEFWAVEF